jgi:hypothetical protein
MSDPINQVIAVKVRSQFAAAIKRAADLEMCSVSELIRRATVAKVRELGIEPLGRGKVEGGGS